MSEFSDKFTLALKVLNLSRGRLAADLCVDKSIVGRWANGTVTPSGHNLARLTTLVAERAPGFTLLDWDRALPDLAARLGADPTAVAPPDPEGLPGLPLPILDQLVATSALRGAAYEGFFRSTRPYVLNPGRFLHDYGMIRRDETTGLLQLRMGTGGTFCEGWMMPLHNQLVCIAADVTSGAMVFGIFNGVAAPKAEVLDGLAMGSALDVGRTPTAFVMMFERIEDLSGDREADDARFLEFAARDPLAPEGSIPPELQAHLVRDIGPAELARGGDWLLQMPLIRSLARGPAYREPARTG
ncbi:helix-turn-helix transcriptional regulator [Phenylobacterium sp.]|uniref:helix-turn-helix transcriptional regulator n=1 Tax=Phenylobacterium sp. TaxID=1871053 RepID=UPI0025DB7FF4|nr:helix-turn-helix transcriptional regulator [Phenylobacterium sp.]